MVTLAYGVNVAPSATGSPCRRGTCHAWSVASDVASKAFHFCARIPVRLLGSKGPRSDTLPPNRVRELKSRLFSVPVLMSPPCSRPARGRVHVTVQQRRGVAGVTLSLKQWAMTYRQVRGRAASLSPKSRPKIPLPAQSALCLPRNPLPAARTVRKTHRFLNGGRVP